MTREGTNLTPEVSSTKGRETSHSPTVRPNPREVKRRDVLTIKLVFFTTLPSYPSFCRSHLSRSHSRFYGGPRRNPGPQELFPSIVLPLPATNHVSGIFQWRSSVYRPRLSWPSYEDCMTFSETQKQTPCDSGSLPFPERIPVCHLRSRIESPTGTEGPSETRKSSPGRPFLSRL